MALTFHKQKLLSQVKNKRVDNFYLPLYSKQIQNDIRVHMKVLCTLPNEKHGISWQYWWWLIGTCIFKNWHRVVYKEPRLTTIFGLLKWWASRPAELISISSQSHVCKVLASSPSPASSCNLGPVMSFWSHAELLEHKLSRMRLTVFRVFDDVCLVLLKRCLNTRNSDLNLK